MKTQWRRKCPKCKENIFHKSEASLKLALRQKRICLTCKHGNQKRKEPYQRVCSGCNKIITYKYASGYFEALKKNRKCNSCSKKDTHPKKTIKSDWARKCSKCDNTLYYSRKDARDSAQQKNKQCRECADNQHRILMVNRSRRLGHYPNFNIKACEIFKELNQCLGWSGIYGTNGGEYLIESLGYYVDYYEPKLNLVIEYDEEHHNRKQQLVKDKMRQERIEKKMGCKFYRITNKTNIEDFVKTLKEDVL